jgi:hypothetical protein
LTAIELGRVPDAHRRWFLPNPNFGVYYGGGGNPMIQLTKDQHDELASNGENTAKVIDPVTNAEYVLVRTDVYERLSGLIDADFHVSDAYAAIDEAFAELWNDPKMDDYDRYEELKK